MNIALLSGDSRSLVNFRSDLIIKLLDSGNKVYCLAPDWDDDLINLACSYGAIPINVGSGLTKVISGRNSISFIKLFTFFRKYKLDAIFSFFVYPSIVAPVIAHFAGIKKIICMIEGRGSELTLKNSSYIERLRFFSVKTFLQISFNFSKLIFVLNNQDKIFFENEVGINPSKIKFIDGIGINLQKWAYSEILDNRDQVCFVFSGRFLKSKGVIEFVEAARILKLKYPSVNFFLLGDFYKKKDSISKSYIANAVDDGVIFAPGYVNVDTYLQKKSVFVLPSYYNEGLPRSIMEAMAVGRPIITCKIQGCDRTVIEDYNGIYIKSHDVDGLVNAMKRFISTPALINYYGKNSRSLAVERFDVNVINSVIINEINEL